jgi:soluble lytic murein transglycosylase-like protein
VISILAISLAFAANESNVGESVRKMQASIEKQRESVRKQAPGAASGFFTTGWVVAHIPEAAPPITAPCEPVPAEQIRKLIVDAAAKEGVNPLLLRAMISRESAGRTCAVSEKGAQGLMQLMPGTSADLGVRDPFDPAENVFGGARYLKQMLDRYKGDLKLALAAYNAGPQRVDDAGGVPSIPETQAYVSAILAEVKDQEQAEP